MSAVSRAPWPRERRLRRAEWRRGHAVAFPDGQTWHFYDPAARRLEHGGKAAVFWDFGVGFLDEPTLTSLNHNFYRLLRKAMRAVNERQRAAANLELAWFLLARNYFLTQDEFARLLATAGESPDLWGAIVSHLGAVVERGGQVLNAEGA